MAWITPTAIDVLDTLPEEEIALYDTLGADGEDVLSGILANVVGMVRSRVAACDKNILDPDATTIPGECKDALLAIVRFRLLARLDAEEPGDQDRRTIEYRDALRYLEAVSKCQASVESGTSAGGTRVRLVQSQPKITGRKNLGGLL